MAPTVKTVEGNDADTKPIIANGHVAGPSSPGEMPGENSSWILYYRLLFFLVLTTVNVLHRYLLIGAIVPMSNELEFGDKQCVDSNGTAAIDAYIQQNKLQVNASQFCSYADGIRCVNQTQLDNQTLCEWYYIGTGIEYEILAGPVFSIILGVLGVPVTILAEMGNINRRNVVAVCTIAWSITILATGLSQTLGEIYLWRFLLGFFQAPFNPFAVSILVAFFGRSQRGLALGTQASGTFCGYGLSYVFIIVVDDIGWRWTYISAGIGGILLGFLFLLTVANPPQHNNNSALMGSFRDLFRGLSHNPWLVFLPFFLAFTCKLGSQYTLSYNINNYFAEYFPDFRTDIFFSWPLALCGIASMVLWGILSDVASKRSVIKGRLWLLAITQFLQIPLYVCFILLDLPANVIVSFASTIIGEGWFGIGLPVIAELTTPRTRTVTLALFFCVIDVLAGCVMVTLAPLAEAVGFRASLLYLGTGLLAGALFFVLACIATLTYSTNPRTEAATSGYNHIADDADDLRERRVSAVVFENSPLLGSEESPSKKS